MKPGRDLLQRIDEHRQQLRVAGVGRDCALGVLLAREARVVASRRLDEYAVDCAQAVLAVVANICDADETTGPTREATRHIYDLLEHHAARIPPLALAATAISYTAVLVLHVAELETARARLELEARRRQLGIPEAFAIPHDRIHWAEILSYLHPPTELPADG